MSNLEGKYNIKAISNMLGIQAGTLRAWERRYKIVAPLRNEAGHRLYTDNHVKILKWLIQKVEEGFTISQAVSLYEQKDLEEPILENVQDDAAEELAERILTALLKFDERKAMEHMNHAFSLFSVEKVMADILTRVLNTIGDLWEAGEITSAHEHFASSFIRSRVSMVLYSQPLDGHLPKALTVCAPGENHELGLMMFTLYLRRKGFEVVYLGASVADGDLEPVINEVEPSFLFLSVTLKDNLGRALQLIDDLGKRYPDLSIGLGGNALRKVGENFLQGYEKNIAGETEQDWNAWLKQELSK